MTNNSKFRGLGTALVTPFNDDGSLDEDALRLVRLRRRRGRAVRVSASPAARAGATGSAQGKPQVSRCEQ